MKALSDYIAESKALHQNVNIEEKLILFHPQVDEKLIVNKDYKTSPFDDDTLMIVRFMKRNIVSENPVLIIEALKNADVKQLSNRVYSISGQEVNSGTQWYNKKFITDNNDIIWELKTDSRSNFIAFTILFIDKDKFKCNELFNVVDNKKLYTVNEIYDMMNMSSKCFPSLLNKLLKDNEKYEVIYYRKYKDRNNK